MGQKQLSFSMDCIFAPSEEQYWSTLTDPGVFLSFWRTTGLGAGYSGLT